MLNHPISETGPILNSIGGYIYIDKANPVFMQKKSCPLSLRISLFGTKSTSDVRVRINHEPNRDEYPNEVHQNKIHPEMQRVWCVQVRATGKPFRAEGHPASIEFSGTENDQPVMTRRIIIYKLLQDVATQSSGTEHSQELERNNTRFRDTPSEICSSVFSPHFCKRTSLIVDLTSKKWHP